MTASLTVTACCHNNGPVITRRCHFLVRRRAGWFLPSHQHHSAAARPLRFQSGHRLDQLLDQLLDQPVDQQVVQQVDQLLDQLLDQQVDQHLDHLLDHLLVQQVVQQVVQMFPPGFDLDLEVLWITRGLTVVWWTFPTFPSRRLVADGFWLVPPAGLPLAAARPPELRTVGEAGGDGPEEEAEVGGGSETWEQNVVRASIPDTLETL
ncbi:uncharacterized protein V6R79_017770 [Siganus canaliculatus]